MRPFKFIFLLLILFVFYVTVTKKATTAPPPLIQTALTLPSQAMVKKISKIQEQQRIPQKSSVFSKQVEDIYHQLPTLNQMASLSSEELHHTPKILLETADQLAIMAELFLQYPEEKETFFSFYKRCAENENFILSVRTLCFKHWREISPDAVAPPKIKMFVAKALDSYSELKNEGTF